MSKNAALLLSGIIFVIIALMHLIRLIYSVEIIVGNYAMPMWASVLALIVSGIVSFLMFNARNQL